MGPFADELSLRVQPSFVCGWLPARLRSWGSVMHLTLSQAFPAVSTLAAGGSGLVGLKDRIEAFGGTMTLDSPSTPLSRRSLPARPEKSLGGSEPSRLRRAENRVDDQDNVGLQRRTSCERL